MKYASINETKKEVSKNEFAENIVCDTVSADMDGNVSYYFNCDRNEQGANVEAVVDAAESRCETQPSFFNRCKRWLEKFDETCDHLSDRCIAAIKQLGNKAYAFNKKFHEESKEAAKRNFVAFLRNPVRPIARLVRRVFQDLVSLSIIAIAVIMIQEWAQANPAYAAQIVEMAGDLWTVICDSAINAYNQVVESTIDPFINLFG